MPAAQGQAGHELRREALPWWIFGVAGGLLTVWLERDFWQAISACPRRGCPGPCWLVFFIPGAVAGGIIGGWSSAA